MATLYFLFTLSSHYENSYAKTLSMITPKEKKNKERNDKIINIEKNMYLFDINKAHQHSPLNIYV